MHKPRVVIGFLGTTLDAGKKEERWQRWRPSVALCQFPDFPVDRLELLHDNRAAPLAEQIAADIGGVSPRTAVGRHILNFRDPWDFGEVYAGMHAFARAYAFDPESEDYFVSITTGTHVAQICWFLLTEAHYIPGRILQLAPPRKGTPGPGAHAVIDLDLSRYDQIATRFSAEREEATSFLKSGIVTENAAFNRMIDEIERVAVRSKAPFLITGPTGAGKSQLARRIYELKRLRHQVEGPFVEVNCATLRGDQAMSALFGHRKGAFTGAMQDRPGLLKSAHGGLLFLDEIGELGLDEQAMILRAVEEKRFLPVGADKDAASEFQLIAGTNRDLARDVAAGRFRDDLYARLNLWTFELPGLRDRREDIAPNVEFELQRFARAEGRKVAFNREARESYLAFAVSARARWSANFRDLSASITRMATLAPNGRINEEVARDEIARLERLWTRGAGDPALDLLDDVLGAERSRSIDLFDRSQLAAVIAQCRAGPSLSAAGRALFDVSRLDKSSSNDADRLRKYLARFGLGFAEIAGRTETASARSAAPAAPVDQSAVFSRRRLANLPPRP
jgi:transcriptional regulatory protein RtcR